MNKIVSCMAIAGAISIISEGSLSHGMEEQGQSDNSSEHLSPLMARHPISKSYNPRAEIRARGKARGKLKFDSKRNEFYYGRSLAEPALPTQDVHKDNESEDNDCSHVNQRLSIGGN